MNKYLILTFLILIIFTCSDANKEKYNPGLSSNYIRKIHVNNDKVYIATNNKLTITDMDFKNFKHIFP